jgi:hypothetical protein
LSSLFAAATTAAATATDDDDDDDDESLILICITELKLLAHEILNSLISFITDPFINYPNVGF